MASIITRRAEEEFVFMLVGNSGTETTWRVFGKPSLCGACDFKRVLEKINPDRIRVTRIFRNLEVFGGLLKGLNLSGFTLIIKHGKDEGDLFLRCVEEIRSQTEI